MTAVTHDVTAVWRCPWRRRPSPSRPGTLVVRLKLRIRGSVSLTRCHFCGSCNRDIAVCEPRAVRLFRQCGGVASSGAGAPGE